ncbi:hypothetical protein HU200_042475 [Digitaria exilis]|uniref:Bifunctional inhibitor/plant lipid transfer protein/seed storage helical domain-containing protein n=1 Tax=Digitaria exilis TaxID=1010633 RepID=A0A835B4Y1_9POAL|nr:hypothetical protein HU200_042475 [Digitaria exilis]
MAGKASIALFLACPRCPLPATAVVPVNSDADAGLIRQVWGVCANVLGLIKAKVGVPPTEPCCPLLEGLVDLEAALCLCTAIKGNILGINLNLPIDLSLILNHCGKTVPTGFKCL